MVMPGIKWEMMVDIGWSIESMVKNDGYDGL